MGLKRVLIGFVVLTFAAPGCAGNEQLATVEGELSVAVAADTYVQSGSSAATSFGTATTVRADKDDGGTVMQGYMRFAVPAQTIVSARLRVYVTNGSSSSADLVKVSNTTWTESTTTWNTKPAVDGPVIGTIGATTSGWVEVDLTSAVQSGQPLSFAIVPRSTDGFAFSSRQASSNRPELRIEVPTSTTPDASVCMPTTCALQTKNCGTISDGCGGTLSCGSCVAPQTCGGGGVTNVCGGGSGTTTLVAKGTVWRFLDNGSNQGTAWRATSFNDTAWSSGAAELGYGDGDEATVVGFGPSTSSRYITTYFRRAFTVTNPTTVSGLNVRIRRDDGAVVYLNGAEVFRTSMPTGTIAYTTLAMSAASETTYYDAAINPALLIAGTNVIAVEVHQSSASSSDISFDLDLIASEGGSCTAKTCAAQGFNCGTISDGCAGTLSCGTCTSPQSCGGGGAPNVCGSGSSSGDPIFVGAGDIASSVAEAQPTAAIINELFANGANANGIVFAAGDNAYDDGSLSEYASFYTPTWGAFKARTRPVPGNHEYHITNAVDYFSYFGSSFGTKDSSGTLRGYYSYDLGAWHIIALDSNISMSTGSEQERWLRADLAAHPSTCTAAYWHRPRYSSGYHGSSTGPQALYQALYDFNADLIVVGHDHMYERFAPQNATGGLDNTRGIAQFLVGTGGASLYAINTPQPNSVVRYNGGKGVVKFTLHPTSYDFQFISELGKTFTDSGTVSCH